MSLDVISPAATLLASVLRRLHNIPTTAIGDGDMQPQARIACRLLFGRGNHLEQPGLQLLASTDKLEPYIITMQLVDFSLQRLDKKPISLLTSSRGASSSHC